MKTFPKSRTKDLVVQEFEKEILIYDLNINKAFCLNETSALVFQLCDGNNSVIDISNLMSRKLKTKVSEDFVYLALNELGKDDLLEDTDELTNHFEGLSRRQIVKRVGLATMLALPVISSVVAPRATMAASLVGLLGVCTTTTDCVSGLTCKTCTQGSGNCNGGLVCCANTDPSFTVGTGSNICIASQTDCNSHASQFCCSGTGIAQPNIACAGFGDSICFCN